MIKSELRDSCITVNASSKVLLFNAFAAISKSTNLTNNLQGERIMKNQTAQNLNESQLKPEEITISMEKIKQLKQEVDQKMIDGIYYSKLFDFLGGKGLEGKAVKVKVVLDLSLIRDEDIIKDPELKDSLRELPGQEFVITACWPCNGNQWCR